MAALSAPNKAAVKASTTHLFSGWTRRKAAIDVG
jgi:hypothetical protein